MRRAPIFLLLAALMLVAPRPSRSSSSDLLDGILLLDLSGRASLKVGSWVRYHTVSSSYLGYHDDYEVLLLIAADEEFWGERCFWLETWTIEGKDTSSTASLISYAVFGDTAAARHAPWFERKTVRNLDENGLPEEMIPKRPPVEFRVPRSQAGHKPAEEEGTKDQSIDTLAVDTSRVPIGSFRGPTVRERNRVVQEVARGDSTVHYERLETRLRKLDTRIPLTRMAREDIDDVQQDRVWLTGQSAQSLTRVLEEARGVTLITGYGERGVPSRVVSLIPRRVSGRRLKWTDGKGNVVSAYPAPAAKGNSKPTR
jgi:hypothetical protein